MYIMAGIIVVLIASLCGAIAKSKNKEPILWTVIGLMTLGMGLLILLVIPDSVDPNAPQVVVRRAPKPQVKPTDQNAVSGILQTEVTNKLVPNYWYCKTADFRVCQSEITIDQGVYRGQLVLRVYNQSIKEIEAVMKIRNILNEVIEVKSKTFNFGEKDEAGYLISSKETLEVKEDFSLGTIQTIEVTVLKVVWEDSQISYYKSEDFQRYISTSKIKTLRKAFGVDAFSDYEDRGEGHGYGCICGFSNEQVVDNCCLCGRSRALIEGSRPKGGIVELLHNCETIEDAQHIIEDNIVRMPLVIGEKLLFRVKNDLAHKQKHQSVDDQLKINRYIEIAMEMLVKG